MNPRAKLWIALALACVGAAWRLYAIAGVEGLNEVHYAEGHLFFRTAFHQPFWSTLFTPDAVYLAIPMRFITIVLIQWCGLVATFPAAFKVVAIALQSLCYTLVLSDRFSALGPFSVRALFAAILLLAPWFETYLPYNTSYTYAFVLLYALWAESKHPALLAVVFLSAFSKPAVLVLIPLFVYRAADSIRHKEHARLPITLSALGGLACQALYMFLHATETKATAAGVYGNLPIAALKNLLVGTGLSPLGLVWFPNTVGLVPHPFAVAVAAGLGTALFAAWGYSLRHAWQRNDRDGVFSFLFPLVTLPTSVVLLMAGFLNERSFAWDLVGFMQHAAHRVHSRHTYFMAIAAAIGLLLLAEYWLKRFERGPRVAVASLSLMLVVVAVGRLHDVPPYQRLESASDWRAYHPLTRRHAYCIPINGFPTYLLQNHCEMLSSETIETAQATVPVIPSSPERDRWRLQGLVVSWEGNAPQTRQSLRLVVKDRNGLVTRLRPLTPAAAKFQFFDLHGVGLRGRELKVEIDGNLPPARRHLAFHYLGARI